MDKVKLSSEYGEMRKVGIVGNPVLLAASAKKIVEDINIPTSVSLGIPDFIDRRLNGNRVSIEEKIEHLKYKYDLSHGKGKNNKKKNKKKSKRK